MGRKVRINKNTLILRKLIKQEFTCSICLDILILPVTNTCGHNYCTSCYKETLTLSSKCPYCQATLHPNIKPNHDLSNLLLKSCGTSYNKKVEYAKILSQQSKIFNKYSKTLRYGKLIHECETFLDKNMVTSYESLAIKLKTAVIPNAEKDEIDYIITKFANDYFYATDGYNIINVEYLDTYIKENKKSLKAKQINLLLYQIINEASNLSDSDARDVIVNNMCLPVSSKTFFYDFQDICFLNVLKKKINKEKRVKFINKLTEFNNDNDNSDETGSDGSSETSDSSDETSSDGSSEISGSSETSDESDDSNSDSYCSTECECSDCFEHSSDCSTCSS